jgi:hypothetical protein
MPVLNPDDNEIFTLRIYKSIDVAADQMWGNTYELRAEPGAVSADLTSAVNKLVDFEKQMHQDTVIFRRAVLSTYVEDGTPYDPLSFVSYSLTGAGQVTSPLAAATLPLQVCLFIRRDVSSGRAGKLFYRQALGEGDVQGRFGVISLTDAAAINTRLATAITAASVDDMLGPTPVDPINLVMQSGVPGVGSLRFLSGLTAVNARIIKYNNRYFDVP